MNVIMFRDQMNALTQTPVNDENLKPARLGSPADGYQPDEDDPAWPSRSGQAD